MLEANFTVSYSQLYGVVWIFVHLNPYRPGYFELLKSREVLGKPTGNFRGFGTVLDWFN